MQQSQASGNPPPPKPPCLATTTTPLPKDAPTVELLLSICNNLALARSKCGGAAAAVAAADDALLLAPVRPPLRLRCASER